ncbi:hypothetical protein V8E53_002600 [Lactarius tabidus]
MSGVWVGKNEGINNELTKLVITSKSTPTLLSASTPNDKLQPILMLYFHLGMNDMDIATSVMDHFDPACYSISTHQQKHTVQSIAPLVAEIKKHFPNRGAETIRKALLLENNIRVLRPIISDYLRLSEPDAIFKRWTFIAIGPNKMWSLNQHNKFKCYGLFFHISLDLFPGVIHWCKVWWTVRNPKLIACFYLDTAQSIGGIPLVTQSDLGTENVNVTYAQTVLCHQMEPSLDGSIQHQWFCKHRNIKPEIHCLLFCFIFIPFIQQEVDVWVHQQNWTKHRADQKKVLPNGIPMLILQKPHKWKAVDYKIPIPPETFDKIERKYAPPSDPVFELVPYMFAQQANTVWTAMGSPQPKFDNTWEIYLSMHDALRAVTEHDTLHLILSSFSATCKSQNCLDDIPEDLKPMDEDGDKDDLLVVDKSDNDEGSILVVDLTDDEDHGKDDLEGHSNMIVSG